jgi:hypothetical protein
VCISDRVCTIVCICMYEFVSTFVCVCVCMYVLPDLVASCVY